MKPLRMLKTTDWTGQRTCDGSIAHLSVLLSVCGVPVFIIRMMSLRVDSLLGRDPSSWIRKNLGIVDSLLSTFQRIQPALQQLKAALNFDKDIRVKHQFRTLSGSVRNCAEQTVVFIDRLHGILSIRGDEARRGRIFMELESAIQSDCSLESMSSASSEYQNTFPQLFDFEDELRVRLEGMKEAQDSLNSICRQIQQNVHYHHQRDMTIWSVWMSRNAAFGVLTFGALMFALGLSGISPSYSQWLFGLLNVPFGIAYLACLGICCKCLSAKYSQLSNSVLRVNEAGGTLRSIASEMICCTGEKTGALVRKSVLVSEVRVGVEKFFNFNEEDKRINSYKIEMERIISSLIELN